MKCTFTPLMPKNKGRIFSIFFLLSSFLFAPAFLRGLTIESGQDGPCFSKATETLFKTAGCADTGFENFLACVPPATVTIDNITAFSADVSWSTVDLAVEYIIEYGPEGFVPGLGTTLSVGTTSITISGLDANTTYDVYLASDCGDDNSETNGPLAFTTNFSNPPSSCDYKLELFDSFGDGWNGASLTVTLPSGSTTFTLNNGNQADFTFEVLDADPIALNYSSGIFENEVSYHLLNSDGVLLFQDGPFPATGEVFTDIASCPVCPAPNPNSLTFFQITDTSATVIFLPSSGAENYTIEYGPAGFPLGYGLTITTPGVAQNLTGLNPCVTYDVYVTATCGVDSTSTTIGPASFTTDYDFGPPGDSCIYTLELFSDGGFGWSGASLTINVGGVESNFELLNGSEEIFEVATFQNAPATVSYNPGFFNGGNSYDLFDPDGNLIFSDGPAPQSGEVFDFISCPTCPSPVSAVVYDVNATNAIMRWKPDPNATDSIFVIEYGSLGFTRGTGTILHAAVSDTSAVLAGLEENTFYDAYIYLNCGAAESSKPLGPFSFKTLYLNDVGVVDIFNPDAAAQCNFGSSETVSITLANFGQLPQTLFSFFFAVNGQAVSIPMPSDGFFTGIIGNDSTLTIDFETTFDFSEPGFYLIEAWTELDTDSDISNDTFRVEFVTALPKPLMEDFEEQVFPENWTTEEPNPIFPDGAHGNSTTVLADNLGFGFFDLDTTFEVTTHRVGPIEALDSLTFDYRFVNFPDGFAGVDLDPGNRLDVQISTDCAETFFTILTIDNSNHVPTTDMTHIVLDLTPFDGESINVRFLTTWNGGNYWIDLDNINIPGCPNTLGLFADIEGASGNNPMNGSIDVNPMFGTPPYFFQWSVTGENTDFVDGLSPGAYPVTVSDANGCTDEAVFEIGLVVAVEEIAEINRLVLGPNPTSGITYLSLELSQTADIQIHVFNMNGQILYKAAQEQVRDFQNEIDLSFYPSGIYFLRIQVENKAHYEKLILIK